MDGFLLWIGENTHVVFTIDQWFVSDLTTCDALPQTFDT